MAQFAQNHGGHPLAHEAVTPPGVGLIVIEFRQRFHVGSSGAATIYS